MLSLKLRLDNNNKNMEFIVYQSLNVQLPNNESQNRILLNRLTTSEGSGWGISRVIVGDHLLLG